MASSQNPPDRNASFSRVQSKQEKWETPTTQVNRNFQYVEAVHWVSKNQTIPSIKKHKGIKTTEPNTHLQFATNANSNQQSYLQLPY